MESHAVDSIGEEFDEGVHTSASLILPNNWHPIDMPAEERHRRQIPDDYTCDGYTPEQRTGWSRERERYMFE